MIIDSDTHISPVISDATIQVESLLEQMEKSGVDRSLCWLQPPYMRDIDESLRYVNDCVRKHPDKLLGFGWVDPHFGVEKGKATIKKCIEEYGFHGVKLNGAQNSFFIDDEAVSLPLVEEIAKTGKALAFHIGADEYDFTHPFRAAKIAKRYPELQIMLVHMGGASRPDLSGPCIEIAAEYPNLHLIGSCVGYTSIVRAIRVLGAERVSFGSDTPFSIMHADVCAYEAFLADFFTPKDRDLVMGENICRVLGIK